MVTFVDDIPRDSHRRYDWNTITAELRANPGKWGIVEPVEGTKSTTSSAQATSRNIRNGRIKGLSKGEFDAVTRGATVYARYVGASTERNRT